MAETIYDREIRERKERGMPFECPPIFKRGISAYQMTCDDCPARVRTLCREATKARQKKEMEERVSFLKRRKEGLVKELKETSLELERLTFDYKNL